MANSNSTTQPQSSLFPLPPGLTPDSIDILPPLSLLLSNLKERPIHNPLSLATLATTLDPLSAPPAPNDTSKLISIKDLPIATDPIKEKLKRARKEVKGLPDIERGTAEQEEEIRELEERIRSQREVLRGLRSVGEGCRAEREERLASKSEQGLGEG